MSACEHPDFAAVVNVQRLTDTDEPGAKVRAFLADVQIRCSKCGQAFHFLGLDQGLDIGGAACSYDRTEAHLTISPDGLPPAKGIRGFTIKRSGGVQS